MKEIVDPVASDTGHQQPEKTNQGDDNGEGEDEVVLRMKVQEHEDEVKVEEMVAPVTSDSGHQQPVKTNEGEDNSDGEDASEGGEKVKVMEMVISRQLGRHGSPP